MEPKHDSDVELASSGTSQQESDSGSEDSVSTGSGEEEAAASQEPRGGREPLENAPRDVTQPCEPQKASKTSILPPQREGTVPIFTTREERPVGRSTASGNMNWTPIQLTILAFPPTVQRPAVRSIYGRLNPGRATVTVTGPAGLFDGRLRNTILPLITYVDGFMSVPPQQNYLNDFRPLYSCMPTSQMASFSWVGCGAACSGCGFCSAYAHTAPRGVTANYIYNQDRVPLRTPKSPSSRRMNHLGFRYSGIQYPATLPPSYHYPFYDLYFDYINQIEGLWDDSWYSMTPNNQRDPNENVHYQPNHQSSLSNSATQNIFHQQRDLDERSRIIPETPYFMPSNNMLHQAGDLGWWMSAPVDVPQTSTAAAQPPKSNVPSWAHAGAFSLPSSTMFSGAAQQTAYSTSRPFSRLTGNPQRNANQWLTRGPGDTDDQLNRNEGPHQTGDFGWWMSAPVGVPQPSTAAAQPSKSNVPGWAHAGTTSSPSSTKFNTAAQQTAYSTSEAGSRHPDNPQRNTNQWSTRGPAVTDCQLGRNEGPAIPPYLSTIREINNVPAGQAIHFCYECMVFFLSFKCTLAYMGHQRILCFCITQFHWYLYLPQQIMGRNSTDVERSYRLIAIHALIQNQRVDEWLRQWGPTLRRSGGLTSGHSCERITDQKKGNLEQPRDLKVGEEQEERNELKKRDRGRREEIEDEESLEAFLPT